MDKEGEEETEKEKATEESPWRRVRTSVAGQRKVSSERAAARGVAVMDVDEE